MAVVMRFIKAKDSGELFGRNIWAKELGEVVDQNRHQMTVTKEIYCRPRVKGDGIG